MKNEKVYVEIIRKVFKQNKIKEIRRNFRKYY